MKHEDLLRHEFGDALSQEAIDRLSRHAELMQRWNRVVRLVGEERPETWIRRHYGESIAGREFWRRSTRAGSGEPRLLDVGSGAGFPGLILAALHPERPVTLVEARERKAAFLAEAARELDLPLVRILRRRFDTELAAKLGGAISCVTIRALRLPEATIDRLVQALPDDGRLVVWAGRRLGSEWTKFCAVEDEKTLPDSRHARILCLRPLRRG